MPQKTTWILGAPMYGFDWPGNGGAGEEATPLEYTDVQALVARVGATPRFDTAAGEWTFTYHSAADGKTHTVWYLDSRARALRFALARDRGLGGSACGASARRTPRSGARRRSRRASPGSARGARSGGGLPQPVLDRLDLELRLPRRRRRVDRPDDGERERARDRLLVAQCAHQRRLALWEAPALEAAHAVAERVDQHLAVEAAQRRLALDAARQVHPCVREALGVLLIARPHRVLALRRERQPAQVAVGEHVLDEPARRLGVRPGGAGPGGELAELRGGGDAVPALQRADEAAVARQERRVRAALGARRDRVVAQAGHRVEEERRPEDHRRAAGAVGAPRRVDVLDLPRRVVAREVGVQAERGLAARRRQPDAGLVVDDLAAGGERDVLERLRGERVARRGGERDAAARAGPIEDAGGARDVVERPRRRQPGPAEPVLAVDEQLAPAVARHG